MNTPKIKKSVLKPSEQIRRVYLTDSRGREYFIEKVGGIVVSTRTYLTPAEAKAKEAAR